MSDPSSSSVSLLGDTRLATHCVVDRLPDDEGLRSTVAELRMSDLVIANLETPLSRRGHRIPKWANLRADPAMIDDVKALGVHAVTLANNHMLDYGVEAMEDTMATCEQAGIEHCGAGLDLDAALKPLWLRANEKRVALLSVASTLPNGCDAAPDKPGVAPLRVRFGFEVDAALMQEQPGMMPTVRTRVVRRDQELVCEQIRRVRAEADLVILAIHWGVPEWWLSPQHGLLAEYQQPLGRAFIEAGADVVFGHHSHSLHPIEVYMGKPIFYSVGNFLFEFDRPRPFMERRTIIVEVKMGNVLAVEMVPLAHDDQGVPHRAVGAEAAEVLAKLVRISEPFGTTIRVEGDRASVVLG